MAKRRHKLTIKNRAVGYHKGAARGRTGKGSSVDMKFKTLGKGRRKR